MKIVPFMACTLLALLVGCGGGGSQPNAAETALLRQVDEVTKGQAGPAWDELHPAQQALVSRDHYIECSAQKTGLSDIHDVKVVDSYEETILIPGTQVSTASTAITIEATISNGLISRTSTDTFHEYNVDGVWRWALSDPGAYADGQCPTG